MAKAIDSLPGKKGDPALYTGTMVVIPTRNRASIATNAIRSVLNQSVEDVNVLVSDNSTSEKDREALATFCSTEGNERLRYVRPPRLLPMSEHWDWAIREALRFAPASHFLYLTDRMMFRKGALKEVLALAAKYPNKVISYSHDRIIDDVKPIRVEQYPGTEKLWEVETLRLLWLFSQSILPNAMPRMLNCIAPRSVLAQIEQRFGNIFCSIAPDFSFCCRCLDTEHSILYFDKAPIFHYALDRSHGASLTRGEITPDNTDFTANLPVDNSFRNFATPIPGLNTVANALFNEYFLFKQQTNSPRFFDVDLQKYLQYNANEITQVIDPAVRADMLSLLIANGYREGPANNHSRRADISLVKRFGFKLRRLATGPSTTPFWLFAGRTLGITPPGQNQFEFATLTDAIDYSANISAGNFNKEHSPEELLEAREMLK